MKVSFFPYQPHSFAFGGFELQMLNAFESVKLSGVDVVKFDLWKKKIDYDIIHLWGITQHNFHIIDYCKKNKIKIFATVLLPYYDSTKEILSHKLHSHLNPNYKKALEYYQKIDYFSVVNELQLEVLNSIYKIPKNKIIVIPNIVDTVFYEKAIKLRDEPVQNYAITTGNICLRKNQLELAKLFEQIKHDLYIVGSFLDGEVEYANEFKKFIDTCRHVIWIDKLENTSQEYLKLYQNCKFFILGSEIETQPISILEAMVLQKPVIVRDCAYVKQSVFKDLVKLKKITERSLSIAIEKINSRIEYEKDSINQFNYKNIGSLYKLAYHNMLNK
jgi:glycosyltransferase involved in cell wall biosynthesis